MSLLLFVAAAVAAVNAPRASIALPSRDRTRVALVGAGASLAVLALLAIVAAPLSDALELTRPTLRIGAGAVAALQGIVTIATRPPGAQPALAGLAGALVPVAFPVLLTPGLGLLAIAGTLDHSAPVSIGMLALALSSLPALAALGPGPGHLAADRVRRGLGEAFAAILLVTGLGLVWNGTFDL